MRYMVVYIKNPTIMCRGVNMETLEQLLANLEKDPRHYDHGMSEEMWMQEKQRDD